MRLAPERYPGWRSRFDAANPDGPQRIIEVSCFESSPLAVLLVRRGGYAVGVAHGAELVASKVGTRYVQSRTAAGGWSQQRFARRRANQADGLVKVVADRLVVLMSQCGSDVAGLLAGGDRALVAQVLTDPRLVQLLELPRYTAHDIGDPRRDVLDDVLRRCRQVEVTIEE